MTTDTLPSEREQMAFDRMGSVRTFDEDGRLKVHRTNLSKACINPYKGSEIPNYASLGLDPHKIYQLLRCPKALKKAASSFDSLPVLLEHVHVSAHQPHSHLVIGATGSNAVFKEPYLENSMSVWDQKAIDQINKEERRELSCAYRYEPVMIPGIYKGKPYDGIMTKIRGNHVALVRKGRAGPDVLVADSSFEKKNELSGDVLRDFSEYGWNSCWSVSQAMDILVKGLQFYSEDKTRPEAYYRQLVAALMYVLNFQAPDSTNDKLAQDFNHNHEPKGSPGGIGGHFAPTAHLDINASEENPREYHSKSFYYKDAQGEEHIETIGKRHQTTKSEKEASKEKHIQSFADKLEKSEELLEFSQNAFESFFSKVKESSKDTLSYYQNELQKFTPPLNKEEWKSFLEDLPYNLNRFIDGLPPILSGEGQGLKAACLSGFFLLKKAEAPLAELFGKKALAGFPKNLREEEKSFSNNLERSGASSKPKRKIDWSKAPKSKEEYLERMPTSVDMLEEEQLGGHGVKYHSSEKRALTRAIKERKKESSFFEGIPAQNAFTSKAIYRRQNEIARRLANGEGEKRAFAVDVKFTEPVGYVFKYTKRGRNVKKTKLFKESTRQMRLIIRKDPKSPKGWRVQSSFPVEEKQNLPFED